MSVPLISLIHFFIHTHVITYCGVIFCIENIFVLYNIFVKKFKELVYHYILISYTIILCIIWLKME